MVQNNTHVIVLGPAICEFLRGLGQVSTQFAISGRVGAWVRRELPKLAVFRRMNCVKYLNFICKISINT